MANTHPIAVPADQAHVHISRALRNNLYSALLSTDGIRNIEQTLDHHLAASGFKDELRRYVTDLFRTGQATTVDEAHALALAKVREQRTPAGETNGTNGVNGHTDGLDEYKLNIPRNVEVEGAKTVQRELSRICEITFDDDK